MAATPDIGFISASLAVRPARLAIMVPPIVGLSWLAVFEAAIAMQGQYWGGQGNIVLPLGEGAHEDPLFWALLDRQDPDGILTVGLSNADMEDVDERWYREWNRSTREQLARDFDHLDEKAIAETIDRFRESLAVEPAPPPDELQRAVSDRLSILDADAAFATVSGIHGPAWPWMDASKFADLPTSVCNPLVGPRCGLARRLWATAQHGRVTSGLRRELNANGVFIHDHRLRSRDDWRRWLRIHEERDDLPWTLGEKGIAFYGHLSLELPPAVVVGDTAWDFALFYALRRWTTAAWWYPSWLRRDHSYRLYLGRDVRRAWRASREVAVVSSSANARVRRSAAQELDDLLSRGMSVSQAHWRDVLPAEPNAYYEWGGEGRPTPIPLVNGVTPALPTPIPSHARARQPLEMHWITEVRVDGWTPVRGSGVGALVLPDASGDRFARTSSRGVAYFCPNVMTWSGNALESAVIRPRLARLPILEQLAGLLAPSGKRCQVSDKGIWAGETVTLFGGLRQTCEALRDGTIRPLLNEYLRRREAGERPYLTFKNAKALVGDAGPGAMAELTDLGVLLRGLHLKCTRCRQEDWYALSEVDDGFVCERCFLSQSIRSGYYLGDSEPAWTYRLAEVAAQMLAHNGDLPLLTIWDAFGGGSRSLDVAHEVEFFAPDDDRASLEVDFVVAHGHELWLGEATKSGMLKDIRRRLPLLSSLAEDLRPYGVMFSTSRDAFRRGAREAFTRAFPGPWPQLRLETGVACEPDA